MIEMTRLVEPATNNPFSDEILVRYVDDPVYENRPERIHVRIWGRMGYFMTPEQAKELRDKLDKVLKEAGE